VGEGAVAVVMEEEVGAVGTGDVQVRPAVAVHVAPGAGAGCLVEQDAGFLADVGESAIAMAPVKPAGAVAERGQEQVELAVAVEVGDSGAGALALKSLQSGAFRRILKAQAAAVREI